MKDQDTLTGQQSMIQCEHVSKIYDTGQGEVRALDNLELAVRQGEFLTVRGPSGCGKTTLLLALGGMLRPEAGKVLIEGRDLYGLGPRERARFRAQYLGFVFQMFHLVPFLSVLENVLLAAFARPDEQTRRRAQELLGQLGLSARAHHTPAQLSAGERQRAAIARALLNRPKLILADEPTGNLDPDNAAEVFRHLREYHEAGGTVIVVTHGAAADTLAARIVELRSGRIWDQD
jgi:ABC-type lipoprotein export system ATPase subunit